MGMRVGGFKTTDQPLNVTDSWTPTDSPKKQLGKKNQLLHKKNHIVVSSLALLLSKG